MTRVVCERSCTGLRVLTITSALAIVASVARLEPAEASPYVGQPTGTFGITIQQGTSVIVDNPSVAVPADIFISDGDPEDFVQIGTIGPDESPIILKIVSEGDSAFRILHFYIDVPESLTNINAPGPTSLIDGLNPAGVDVTIAGLAFTDTTYVLPMLLNDPKFGVTFQRDELGRFYNLDDSTTTGFPGPATQVQVYGPAFFDSNPQNAFLFVDGATATWTWLGLQNPGATAGITVNDGFTPDLPGSGFVFELGLGVAFVGIPEPGTLILLLAGAAMLYRRRRR